MATKTVKPTELVIMFDRLPEIAAAMPGKTRNVIMKTAYDIEAQAKIRAPVDTGTLRNSIMVDLAADGMSAVIAPHTEYAAFVEFGTRRMDARPYMVPALESVRPGFERAMGIMLQDLISGKAIDI